MVLTRILSAGGLVACVAATSAAQRGAVARGWSDDTSMRTFGPRPMLFGFALECTRCTAVGRGGGMGGRRGGAGEPTAAGGRGGALGVWRYDEYPRVATVVAGGAAQLAGIREGDMLLAVDGLSITSDEGSQRFSELRAGDTAHLSLDRAGKTIDVDLVLGRGQAGGFGRGRGQFGGGMGVVEAPAADAPNFTTRANDTRVDVWSDARIVQSTDSTGATILRIGSTVIRLAGDSPVSALRRGRGRLSGSPPMK
jgi:membrane-associated protease RseP (regulator of RpoE activity)